MRLALDMDSPRLGLLVRKIGFLKCTLLDRAIGVGAAAMHEVNDGCSLCLVRKCSWK